MRNLLVLSIMGCTAVLRAQQCTWLHAEPLAYESNPSMPNVVVASAPERLVAAWQNSGVFIYGSDLYGDAALVQLDPLNGSPLWSCPLGDTVNVESAAVSSSGMAYFAGRFMGDLALCDGSVLGGVQDGGPWTVNVFLVAVDLTTGMVEWKRNLTSTHDQALGVPSLAIDPAGNLWYAVLEWGVGKAVRVDESGQDVETRIVDGVRNLGSISFDPWGGLYMSGAVDDAGFAFGGQAYQGYGGTGYNMFVLRFKPDGTAGFAAFAPDITFQDPTVVATYDGHAYLAGNLFDVSQWGDIVFDGPEWSSGLFLTRLDSVGDFLWGREAETLVEGQITGDVLRSKGPCIAVDAADQVYVMADVRGTVGWDNGVTSGSGPLSQRVQTMIAFNPAGMVQWSLSSEPSNGYQESRTLTASALPNTVHFAGHVRDPLTFGSHTVNQIDQQAAVLGMVSSGPTDVGGMDDTEASRIWPVPASSTVRFHVDESDRGPATVMSSDGRFVLQVSLSGLVSELDVHDLVPGVYTMRTAKGTVMRFVKE